MWDLYNTHLHLAFGGLEAFDEVVDVAVHGGRDV